MGLYAGADNFPAEIYQFEETDLVLAASDNVPLQHLADRTIWLKNKIGLFDRLQGETIVTASANIPATQAGYLTRVYSTGILNLSLEDVANFKPGALVVIASFCNPACVVNIKPLAGQTIFDSDGALGEMHMHHKEYLILQALTNHWNVVSAVGNFHCAGEEVKGRKEIVNTLALKGQLLERSKYPRLWKYANSLTLNQQIVSEATWFLDATTYRGLFSTGDGLTTFRLPDERGMFERMLDLGRGIDLGRIHNFAGGYEADELKAHGHSFTWKKGQADQNESGTYGSLYDADATHNRTTNTTNTGGTETRPKNIGKLNLIKF